LLLLLFPGASQLKDTSHPVIGGASLPFVSLLAQGTEIQGAADAMVGGLEGG